MTLVATKEKVISFEAFGFADLAHARPMKRDTVFWIASQTKPITGGVAVYFGRSGASDDLPPNEREWFGSKLTR